MRTTRALLSAITISISLLSGNLLAIPITLSPSESAAINFSFSAPPAVGVDYLWLNLGSNTTSGGSSIEAQSNIYNGTSLLGTYTGSFSPTYVAQWTTSSSYFAPYLPAIDFASIQNGSIAGKITIQNTSTTGDVLFDSSNVKVQVGQAVGPFVSYIDPTKQPVITSVVEQSVPTPPTCVAPQVLQGNVCVTPTPTCVAPQVLQGNACVTPPPPTCVAPQVLQGNACVTPPAGFTASQDVCISTNCATNIVSFENGEFHVDVDIGLTAGIVGANPSIDLINFWEAAINDVWNGNDHYVLTSDGYSAQVVFDVNFSAGAGPDDWAITYWDYAADSNLFGTPNAWWNSENFFSSTVSVNDGVRITLDQQNEGRIIAHEFGHLLGIYDEYPEGNIKPGSNPEDLCTNGIGNWCKSMMADYGPLQERYMADIIALINRETHRTFGFGPPLGPQPSYLFDPLPEGFNVPESPITNGNSIPEPGTLWLMMLAILGLIVNSLPRPRCCDTLNKGT